MKSKKYLVINPTEINKLFIDETGDIIDDIFINLGNKEDKPVKIDISSINIATCDPFYDKEPGKVTFTIFCEVTDERLDRQPNRLKAKFKKGDRVRVRKWAKWNPNNDHIDKGHILTVSGIKSLCGSITYLFLPNDNSFLVIEEIFNEDCLTDVGDTDLEIINITSEAEAEASKKVLNDILDEED